jgi:hypothetical protein
MSRFILHTSTRGAYSINATTTGFFSSSCLARSFWLPLLLRQTALQGSGGRRLRGRQDKWQRQRRNKPCPCRGRGTARLAAAPCTGSTQCGTHACGSILSVACDCTSLSKHPSAPPQRKCAACAGSRSAREHMTPRLSGKVSTQHTQSKLACTPL